MDTDPSPPHIAALDGIRGMAIALVMLRHLSLVSWFRESPNRADQAVAALVGAGWTGVDLFFVLSGFLITRILLREQERPVPGSAKFARFYWRRMLRIFPLYYAACAILFFVLPVLPYFGTQPEIAVLPGVAPWYWLYATNVLRVVHGAGSLPFNTAHFWSLAVEEQFYMVWPFVVLWTRRETLLRVAVGMILAGPLVRVALMVWLPVESAAPSVLSIARIDVLGVGALLALTAVTVPGTGSALRTRTSAFAPVVGVVAALVFALIVVTRGTTDTADAVMVTAGYTASALVMGAIVANVTGLSGGASLAPFFRSSSLRTLGKYSYCLYIVHYPLTVVLELLWTRVHIPAVAGSRLPAWTLYGLTLVMTSLAIAWVSWRVLEAPLLALKSRFHR